MKLLLLSLAALASVQGAWLGGSSALAADETYDVPGKNPLHHCQNPEGDVLILENVDLDPNPPQAGKTLTITATGNLTKPIDEGAKIHLSVKYGLITIIKQTADLCDTIKNVDLECPVDEGQITIEKKVDLPKQIPPGTYHVSADAETKDEDRVTCLQADVQFKRGGGDDGDGDGDDDDKEQQMFKEDM